MPYVVVVIDELADIMIQAGRDVEPVLSRLMALARATGIHLIIATQRPDVKTISGTIKANIPGRVALGTANATDSRTILDESGAEYLCAKGDMLYKSEEGLGRTQGALITQGELSRIMAFIVKQWPAQIDDAIVNEMESEEEKSDAGDAVNEAGDAFVPAKVKAVAKALRKELGPEARQEGSLPERLDSVARLIDEERTLKKSLKAARTSLDERAKEAIEDLDDDQARLLLSTKWIDPLVSRLSSMPDATVGTLVDTLNALSDKYATTYADIDAQIQSAEEELVGMLGELAGDEFDMAGIRELASLLGGEAR